MEPLNVALVWHMHQPDYRDPESGRSLLPWTYLHAVKDYAEMLQIARETPGVRLTVNLTPTLIEQIDSFSSGSKGDDWLDHARKDPEDLSEKERYFLVSTYFSVFPERHIRPYPRFRELAGLRGDENLPPDPGRFSVQDLRDLQVWFLLSWSGHCLRRDSTVVRELLEKGGGFSEADRTRLLQTYDEVVAGVLDRYREAEGDGAVEISLTPYAHPILPLLCDTSVALQARSDAVLPLLPFRYPEDARLQVRYGRQVVERRFGRRKRGMWPAEGAVSEAAVKILREEDVRWAASDEGILAKSLPLGLTDRRDLYRAYSFAGLPLLFRDRELSDRIGFLYAPWGPREAAGDLLERLRTIARTCPGGVVTLILDGENCWERYQDNGYPFLTAFYRGLLDDPALRMVTVTEALEKHPPVPLPHLAPGSWINSDFDVWIGNREENTAWERLARTRQDFRQGLPAGGEELHPGWLNLLRAEGSDWFWWFGHHHRTDQAETFDRLFRCYLQGVYRETGKPVPGILFHHIVEPREVSLVTEPAALFTPRIDGRVTDYFEWLAAGTVDLKAGGAMHHEYQELTAFYYGYDIDRFYLRIDFSRPLVDLTEPDGVLELRFLGRQERLIRFEPKGKVLTMQNSDGREMQNPGQAASGRIFELALTLQSLDLAEGGCFELSCHLRDARQETARWPVQGTLKLCYRGHQLEEEQWPI
jgi:alpha-amylase/alpha-mannosidase (GH57 family)